MANNNPNQSKFKPSSESSQTTFPSGDDFTINTHLLNYDLNRIHDDMDIPGGANDNKGLTITQKYFKYYNRYKHAFPSYYGRGFGHVFFTRPDLNFFDGSDTLNPNLQSDSLYSYLHKNNIDVLKSLTKDQTNEHDFNLFLSNTVQSFDLQDETLETKEHGETYLGHKIVYAKNNIKSLSANTFSIKYTDDSEYTNYKIHKAWTEYMSRISRGALTAKDKYRYEKTLDYAVSAYYIVCGPDETILFWTKYYGVFPLNSSASSLGWSAGEILRNPQLDFSYQYSWKEDYNPAILMKEFNKGSVNSLDKIYESNVTDKYLTSTRTFVGPPYVQQITNSVGQVSYKLKFRKDNGAYTT